MEKVLWTISAAWNFSSLSLSLLTSTSICVQSSSLMDEFEVHESKVLKISISVFIKKVWLSIFMRSPPPLSVSSMGEINSFSPRESLFSLPPLMTTSKIAEQRKKSKLNLWMTSAGEKSSTVQRKFLFYVVKQYKQLRKGMRHSSASWRHTMMTEKRDVNKMN